MSISRTTKVPWQRKWHEAADPWPGVLLMPELVERLSSLDIENSIELTWGGLEFEPQQKVEPGVVKSFSSTEHKKGPAGTWRGARGGTCNGGALAGFSSKVVFLRDIEPQLSDGSSSPVAAKNAWRGATRQSPRPK